MGLFLNVVIVQGGTKETVESVFKQLSASNPEWELVPEACRFSPREQGVMVLLNENCIGFDSLGKSCSEALKCPVMLSYIYDGDYWGYYLFVKGREVDCYSAIPDYFEELPEQELQKFAGKSDVIAEYFHVARERVSKYLQRWTAELLEQAEESFAYDGDEYSIGTDWQMADFLAAIGWPYEW